MKFPAGLPDFLNQEDDSLATESREFGPIIRETGCTPEVTAGSDLPKDPPQIVEPLTSHSGNALVTNSVENFFNEAREKQVTSKGLVEEAREQDHADLKVPLFKFLTGNDLKNPRKKHKKGLRKDFVTQSFSENGFNELAGSKRKLMGDLITGDRKRVELGDISNSGISAVVAMQPRREL